jgi:hypothetical protein
MTKITIGGITREILMAKITKFTVIKNKTGGTPFEDGEYKYYIKPYKGNAPWTFDNEDALFEAGRFHGLIKVTAKGFEYENIATKMPHLFLQELRDDEQVRQKLYDEILECVLKFNAGEGGAENEAVEEEV